ncbi:MAG: hypothetical protein LBI89_01710 [Prevotellaceae bacterium]|nr:hypothetical protein [Prevotellaceae bacterium]
MKKIFFSFAMLASVAASAQVTNVEPVGANYVAKTVSFRVRWSAASRDATHLSKVWVWVDCIAVNSNNTTSGNSWERALVSGTPTANAGTPSREAGNDKGFWLQGNAGSYSATVTVQLNIAAGKFNWCAYASDFPPNVTATNGTYTFRGTPPFTLIASSGTATQTVPGKTLAASALTVTPVTIKDRTECPGVFCPYTGIDLYIDATNPCRVRPGGAKNWEAWIKDTRDNGYYRIVYMPDNKWWLAQNVKLASYNSTEVGVAISGCNAEECGRAYSWEQVYASYAGGTSGSSGNVQGICPPGWSLPLRATFSTLATSIGSAAVVCSSLRALDSNCSPVNDTYGFASAKGVVNGAVNYPGSYWYTNDDGREDGFGIDCNRGQAVCNAQTLNNPGDSGTRGAVRCYRQL